MEKMIACCGIGCHECGAFIATKSNDDQKRKEVAAEWSKMYNSDIKPEDIYCDGCISEGEYHFNYCNVCEIRKCARAKDVKNCAYCDDYACEILSKFFQMVPAAEKTLSEIRSSL